MLVISISASGCLKALWRLRRRRRSEHAVGKRAQRRLAQRGGERGLAVARTVNRGDGALEGLVVQLAPHLVVRRCT